MLQKINLFKLADSSTENMEIKHKKPIEEIVNSKEFTVKKVRISDGIYSILMNNMNNALSLNFCTATPKYDDAEYSIQISEEGISFQRLVKRPNHDHDNIETLQVVVDSAKTQQKEGELVWRDRFPYNGDGYKLFHIPFGGKKVNY